MHNVYLSLGSNLGNRRENLQHACDLLQKRTGNIFSMSSLYETEPWGFIHENPFCNQVIGIRSRFTPATMLEKIQGIEKDLGRKNKQEGYAARIIDIDMLFCDDLVMDTPAFRLPHPLIPQRRFVLVPLAEIAPALLHPVLHTTVTAMLEACEDKGWVRMF